MNMSLFKYFIHLWSFRLLPYLGYCNTVIKEKVQKSPQGSDFASFGYMLRSRTVGSCATSIFNFLRNFHILFIMTVPI